MDTITSTIIGVLAGGIITFIVSWVFYIRAGNELREETKRLRTLSNRIITGLGQIGAKTKVDDNGDLDIIIPHFLLNISPGEQIQVSDEVKLTVHQPKESK